MTGLQTTISDSIHLFHQKPGTISFSTDSTQDFQSLLASPGQTDRAFFTSHEMKPGRIHPLTFPKYQSDWILAVLVLCFVLLAWAQVIYRRRLRQIVLAPFSKRHLSQLVRDGDLISERISIATVLIYVMAVAMVIYEVFGLLIPTGVIRLPEGFERYAIISGSVTIFWVLKIGLIRFLGFIFRTRLISKEYILNIFIFNILTGILLLPMLVFVIYLKSAFILWLCILVACVLFTIRVFRGFLIGIAITKFSYVFLFVYLCSLEILPLVALTKVVMRYFFQTIRM